MNASTAVCENVCVSSANEEFLTHTHERERERERESTLNGKKHCGSYHTHTKCTNELEGEYN